MSTENVVKVSVLPSEELSGESVESVGFHLIDVPEKEKNEREDRWTLEILPALRGLSVTVTQVYISMIKYYGKDSISRMRVYKKIREWEANGVCVDTKKRDKGAIVYKF